MPVSAAVTSRALDDGWKFCQARQGNWHEAKVPGEVHTDLMRAHIIDDPFIAMNERSVQWVDKEDWIYQTTFEPDSDILSHSNIDIVFKGIDTYADVYLNDSLILKADNMFRQWRVPVKDLLKRGGNTLRVYLHSPIKTDLPKFNSLDFAYEACNDQSENGGIFDRRVSVFARKAGYHYGWDWGPRLVTSGIWRPVALEGWSDARIDNMFVETERLDKKKALMQASVTVVCEKPETPCRIEIVDLSSGKRMASKAVSLSAGANEIALPFTVGNPRLWWCNGLGNPELYDFRCRLVIDGKPVAESTVTTGIRTIEVVRDKDSAGTSFYFRLNGVPVFAKGANYIPCDNFLSRVTKDVYDRTIRDAVDANMNMLRVWGGGIYEDDYFYNLCDRNGLMVWQDFMFACSLYPADKEFLENIRHEAVDNVVRLRNHPSIAIWCGNNECLEAWHGWGWKSNYVRQGVDSIIWSQYDTLFHHVLPEIVARYAPKAFYWPSSPFSRYDGVAQPDSGDSHLWTVWGQRHPIDEYNHVKSRFFSEYGFQSFPTIETVRKYAPDPNDWDISSDVMMAHQRGGKDANKRIMEYLAVSYPQPKDFESLLYMTQILQGDAIRTAIESHRRNKPYCMGSLFWQHNDCWPVASWSSRDYYGNWKAQHYFARKAFDDIMLSCVISADTMSIYTVSDRRAITDGRLRLNVLTLGGDTVFTCEKNLTVPADAVTRNDFSIASVTGGRNTNELVISGEYITRDGKEYSTVSTFIPQKEMNYASPHITRQIEESEGRKLLTLTADTFVRGLFISVPGRDCRYSDNFFDMLPAKPVTVEIDTDADIAYLRDNLKLTHLYSSSHN